MRSLVTRVGRRSWLTALLLAALAGAAWLYLAGGPTPADPTPLSYHPRKDMDPGGFSALQAAVPPWRSDATLQEIRTAWDGAARRRIAELDRAMGPSNLSARERLDSLLEKAALLNSDGEAIQAYVVLAEARRHAEGHPKLAEEWLYTIVYCQGVTGLRRGENENCIQCRGESSCILPISKAAVHVNPAGSRLAIDHFTEYLQRFPKDLEVTWLLNLAWMTLGESPSQADSRYLLSLDRFSRSEFDIGRFRDIGARVGVHRFNQAGGAILEDFDGDGRLDLFVTTWDATQPAAFYRNRGDGTFEDRSRQAGLAEQFGGLYCVQADYDNDGHPDVFVVRGAWRRLSMRPSLLKNEGDGTFVDVTEKAGLLAAVNSNSACWADYDNDGHLDLFVCCEQQQNRLYRNRGDGTFEEVARKAGVGDVGQFCKGAAWVDLDNDDYPDLFLNNYHGPAKLYHNNRDGTFADVTVKMGIEGPVMGFACWAWDYDNDGWLDLFATCYDRPMAAVVKGLLGQPHNRPSNRLFRNLGGKGFRDVSREAGLDVVFATMGCNFADFDNDGYLDLYLGTGDPKFSLLVPNRMFKNVAGKRFAEITASSGTGHLQKGHAVSCGDWDRDGNVDLFVETGGAVDGDRYHNVLFQNPGQGNNWLSVKLVGKRTNRSAIGARVKVVTAGEGGMTIHRHVTSGSSFGANPLEQLIGVGKAGRVATLEVHWPTSGTTQVFRDVAVNQAIEITEFADGYVKRPYRRIPLPKGE